MKIRLPFDKEAWKFAGIFAVAALFLGFFSTNMGWVGFLLTVACLMFFRDPDRVQPSSQTAVVSPADGIVLKISEAILPTELGINERMKKVSIFMSVLNVHVNRSPIKGVVEKIVYIPGKFFNVTLDKSSEENERQITCLRLESGLRLIFVQIAGLIARRIRCDIQEGQELATGERVGMIRFGSRVDLYIPLEFPIMVEEGQVMVAGETVITDLKFAKKEDKKPATPKKEERTEEPKKSEENLENPTNTEEQK